VRRLLVLVVPELRHSAAVVPVKLRRQIGSEVFDAECGMPLVDDD
jgi:hypothetical protein